MMKYLFSILVVFAGLTQSQAQITEISFIPTLTDCAGNPVPCSNSTICFEIQLETVDIDDFLSSYTLILSGGCAIQTIVSNESCVINDNSFAPTPCVPIPPSFDPGVIFQSNGNAGNYDVDPGVPVRIHTLCVELGSGENTVDFSDVNLTVDYINTTAELNPDIVGPTSFNVPMVCDTLLPVELMSFTVKKKGKNEGLLEWVTATELNTNYFEVERSFDGFSFRPIGQVSAQGDSYAQTSYSLVDAQPLAGKNYYRLRIVDYDGSYEYSEIRTLEFEGEKGRYTVFPNPVKDVAYIQTDGVVGQENTEVQVFDSRGTMLLTHNLHESDQIDLSNLSQGTYIIQVVDVNGEILMTDKLIKISR